MRHPSTQIATAVSGVLRALAIGAPIAFGDAPAVLAQSTEPAAPSAGIPAQPLGQALAALARQTGLQLLYVSGLVRNQTSHAVPAGLSANAALAAMLQGTGLRFAYLTANSVRIFAAAPAPEARIPARMGDEPSEVIITASRREENFQDVPIAIQTMTGDQLSQLNVTTFDDLLQYTPNVTYSGNGPGTGNIFIRGLGFVGTGNQSQSTTAPFPAVALYLDNQSMQFPARNNDVYLIDMARVEVLEGPQGTLYGGGAQAGVIRYVTNKPNLSVRSGEFNAGFGTTAGGDPNNSLNATLNLPLIPETLAVRLVMFSERRGGYISNVPGTIAFTPGSIPAVEGGNPSANNAHLVASDTNPVTYQGVRLSALYQLNDDWNLLIQQNYQDMDAEGYFYAYPEDPSGNALQPYQITAFTPAYNKDRYESTAWTLNGSLGGLKAVYSGSYLVRHIEAQQDYSNYLSTFHAGSYYACIGPGAGYFNSANFQSLTGKRLQCYPPVGSWYDSVRNTHQTHELRITTGEDHRIRALAGAYWEKFVIDDNMNFNYLAIPQCSQANLTVALAGGPDCLSAVGPLPGVYASDPSLRENTDNAFGEDEQRGYRQYAFFASVDFDLIPKVLTLSGGTRRYHYDEFEHGSVWYSESTSNGLIIDHPNGACTAAGLCGFPLNLDKSEGGFSSRANLTWHLTPDIMTYYTFAQGFRPGGFNRASSAPGQPTLPPRFAPYCGAASTDPRCGTGGSLSGVNTDQAYVLGYDSDTLVNNELGFKSEFLSHRLLLNAAAYRMNWNHVASDLYDPAFLGPPNWVVNGPSYTIKGIELQLTARLPGGLTLQGASSWNSVRQANSPCLISTGVVALVTPNNPTPAGECITVVGGLPYPGPWGPAGTSAPFAPPHMFNLRARYDWSIGSYRPFAIASAGHIAGMSTAPGSFPDGNAPGESPPTTTLLRYTIPAYTIYDASFGVTKDNWTAQISGSNLANTYAPTNVSAGEYIRAEIPLRPRVVTAMFGYKF
ncbi:MAG: TonB-dependent receptor domain-containing protein [Steroidobacteraceae bacterium]